MSRRRVSRFERRILAAIFLAGIAPFVISLMFLPAILELRVGLSVHERVRAQLEASAVFYKEFFDTKKREFAARAEAIARDPILLRAAAGPSVEDLEARLSQTIDDNADVASLTVFDPKGATISVARRKLDAARFTSKTLLIPLGVGEAPKLAVELVMSKSYIADRDRAEEVAKLYAAASKYAGEFQKESLLSYVLLTSVALFAALALGYLLARQVTKRISELVRGTERVASGELDARVEPKGRDEITELTGAFNKMVADVQSAQDRIVYLEKVSGWQELARRLAHEIKNPLTPIQLAIQELRRRAPEGDPKFSKLVEDASSVVEEEIASLTRLVNEFSQFARLPEVVPETVEVRGFVEEFLAAYNRFEPDAQVDAVLGSEELKANLDRVLMRRVLANLATNAIQAAGVGKARLRISCARVREGVEIRIEDNGPGVPIGDEEKIFEPYFTTKSEGTGLGLAIVKKIVLQHQGTVRVVRSSLGGAGFSIRLPSV
ncbi:MAG: HAMP domain-containing protein [Deltaproteobacteria bacterium]|nr:HAMP domain-containing protein [Deltaproteobacteria bacterium]